MPITKSEVMEQHGYEAVAGTTFETGMEFVVFVTEDDERRYHAIHEDTGDVNRKPLSKVYSRGNLTLARVADTGREVMVDDEKLHYDWDE